ncbi:MAG: filamentous hemagglutinin N-terminal domain-containing protein, partial [Arenicellales bacterium]
MKNTMNKPHVIIGLSALISLGASANPVNPNVMHGSAQFTQNGDTLNIQNTPGTIINWQDFSISNNEVTRFIQQNSASSVLNRVVGQLPSNILGELSSNGKVFLINPNGLLIGNGAMIDTAGFLGSTLDITNADFLAGRLNFKGASGEIEN